MVQDSLRFSDGASFFQYKLFHLPSMIDISNNTMNGNIPMEIGRLFLPHLLYLDNNFSRNIPEKISKASRTWRNWTFHESFVWKNPIIWQAFFLKSFDVSYHNLEGSIPIGMLLQSFDVSAFEGNQKLCGDPLPKKCLPVNSVVSENGRQNQISWFQTSVALGFIVGFWGLWPSHARVDVEARYAYFKFLDTAQDRLYVIIMVCMAKMQIEKA